jgi:hypothetical protein
MTIATIADTTFAAFASRDGGDETDRPWLDVDQPDGPRDLVWLGRLLCIASGLATLGGVAALVATVLG